MFLRARRSSLHPLVEVRFDPWGPSIPFSPFFLFGGTGVVTYSEFSRPRQSLHFLFDLICKMLLGAGSWSDVMTENALRWSKSTAFNLSRPHPPIRPFPPPYCWMEPPVGKKPGTVWGTACLPPVGLGGISGTRGLGQNCHSGTGGPP